MIKIDYIIERKLSDNNIKILKPDKIPSELPNIVYIEGPNDSGKSTMLNLIALSFYGLKNENIKGNLKAKLINLMDTKYQKIKFSVNLISKNGKIQLRAIKNDFDSKDIIVEENINNEGFQKLGLEKFNNKYNLIYDIPENPTKRLFDLLNELEIQQYRIGEQVKEINTNLHNIITEINESRNPKRIAILKEYIGKYEERNKHLEITIPESENIFKEINKYYNFTMYDYYLNEFDKVDKLLKKLKELNIKNKGKKIGTPRTETSKLQAEINRKIDEIYRNKNEIRPLLLKYIFKNDKKKIEEWEKISLYDTSDYKIDENLDNLISEYLGNINPKLTELEKNPEFKSSTILKDITQFLNKYSETNFTISKLQINLKELITILNEENRNFEQIQQNYDALKDTQQKLINIGVTTTDTNQLLGKLKEIKISYPESDSEVENLPEKIRKTQNELNEIVEKLETYYSKCLELGIEKKYIDSDRNVMLQKFTKNVLLTSCLSMNSEQLKNKIEEMTTNIELEQAELKSNLILLEQYKGELSKLEKMKKHKYEDKKDQINTLFEATQKISGKILYNYPNIIKNIKNNQLEKNENSIKYYAVISKYLANKIQNFWYIETKYEAKEVDLINDRIITKEGNTIRISDLGTGRGQSAYLKGLLNIYSDNRIMISLFDEISAMDKNSLEPIFLKIKELYNENKLIAGMLVQKLDDRVNVISLEE